MLTLRKDKDHLHNYKEAISYEWLETNGLGGFASSTIPGCNTRRYHGLLVAAVIPPAERMVLVSKLDETIIAGDKKFELGCNNYGGAISPQGYVFLDSFSKQFFPEFIYEAENIRLRKTIAMVNGENTTLIIYEVIKADKEFTLELLPLIAVRDYHELTHSNDEINRNAIFENGHFRILAYKNTPEVFISIPTSSFIEQPAWYNHFEYSNEKEGGHNYQEDLFSHGVFRVPLHEGQVLGIILSTVNTEGRDALKLFAGEKSRRQSLLKAQSRNDVVQTLTLAADQFIVQRDQDLKSVIAGYHWFTDWSRDTMISLHGLCLVTNRFAEAKKILQAFGKKISMGMLPNRFNDHGLPPEYNNVDGTLWYFIAVYGYMKESGDKKFVLRELLPILSEIIDWHFKGTRFNIHADDDGLLFAGEPGVQLTWMDAKVGDWVVTPRIGKAVEINALWYNALCIYSKLLAMDGDEKLAKIFRRKAKGVQARFIEIFWNDELKYLNDVVNGEEKDVSLRPNQLLALGLYFPIIKNEKAESILAVIKKKLLTPAGLRSLSPDDPHYKGIYTGAIFERDAAYHQGTVWAWLLGPYADAVINHFEKEGKKEITALIQNFSDHLNSAGIGTISEIFDGDSPHTPRGCIAQAWSVAELLRVIVQYKLFKEKSKNKK